MGKYQEARVAKDLEIGFRYDKDVNFLTSEENPKFVQMIYPNLQDKLEQAYPVILYLLEDHSNTRDIYDNIPGLVKFANRGYAVAMIKYQSQPDSLTDLDNLCTAMQFLQVNASKYHLDMNRLCVLRDAMEGEGSTKERDLKMEQDIEELKALVSKESTLHNLKALVSLGGKELIDCMYHNTDINLPPILLVLEDENTYYQNIWSENNLDMIEDFISNYI